MSKNTTPYMLQADVYTNTVFQNADTTNIKDICDVGTEGSYVYEISITGTNSATRDITIYLNDGVTDIPIKLATVAINQGTVIGQPDPLRLIQPSSGAIGSRLLDRDQNYYIPLPLGWKVRMKVNVTLTAGQTLNVLTHRKDF